MHKSLPLCTKCSSSVTKVHSVHYCKCWLRLTVENCTSCTKCLPSLITKVHLTQEIICVANQFGNDIVLKNIQKPLDTKCIQCKWHIDSWCVFCAHYITAKMVAFLIAFLQCLQNAATNRQHQPLIFNFGPTSCWRVSCFTLLFKSKKKKPSLYYGTRCLSSST